MVQVDDQTCVPEVARPSAEASAETPTTPGEPCWREVLAPYSRPNPRRGAIDVATSVVPYLALWALMYLTIQRGEPYPLTLLLAIPTAGFLVRTYIVFHDCAHGSFLGSRRANAWLGTSIGLLVFETFLRWRHEHAVHHATAGDLERRGVGDVSTLTVAEYRACSRWERLGYRLFRSPLVMFGLGPIIALIVQPRIVPRASRPRIKHMVIATNLALAALIAGLCLLLGWRDYLLVQGPIVMIGGAAGIWLFYVQHQFDDAYWERGERWSYVDAALQGSAYLKLPKVLQFFSGNIGLHHVHHLNPRIPNYNLQRAHDDIPMLHDVTTLSLVDGLRVLRLKLYDEDRQRMVTFAEAR